MLREKCVLNFSKYTYSFYSYYFIIFKLKLKTLTSSSSFFINGICALSIKILSRIFICAFLSYSVRLLLAAIRSLEMLNSESILRSVLLNGLT